MPPDSAFGRSILAFVCFQNPAGVARANFSIRVIESVGGLGGTSANQVNPIFLF
jgi:hypothetical protein